MEPVSTIVLPIFKLLINKASSDIVSDVGNNIRKAIEGQALIEFSIKECELVYLTISQFRKEFDIPCSTLSQDDDSIVLAFPGDLKDYHVNYFFNKGMNPKR